MAAAPPAEPIESFRGTDVLAWRFERSLLGLRGGADATVVADRLVGVQAQVMSSAEVAMSLRASRVTPASVRRALWDDRTLIKSWTARGTLHLVAPDDLALWCGAMSARGEYWAKPAWERYHGITAAEMTRILDGIDHVLAGECLTRAELAERLGKHTRLPDLAAHVMGSWGAAIKPPAFRGLLCFGPSEGRNVTFVSPRHWIGSSWEPAGEDDALAALTRRYVDTYGPSTLADLTRWLGVEAKVARRAWTSVLDELLPVAVDGEPAYVTEGALAALSARTGPTRGRAPGTVRLLPAFDPYVVGVLQHLERLLPEPGLRAAVSRTAGWITPTIVIDGRIVGVWRYQRGAKGVTIELEPFGTLSKAHRAAADRLVEPMAALLGRAEEPDADE